MSPGEMGQPVLSRQRLSAALCPPSRRSEQQEVASRSREEQVRGAHTGGPVPHWVEAARCELPCRWEPGMCGRTSPRPGEAVSPSTVGGGQAHSSCSPWGCACPQEPGQQSPREMFMQKERAVSTASTSSPQPGESSLCLALS